MRIIIKNIFTTCVLLSLSLGIGQAQNNYIESFYEQYSKDERVTNVTIKGWLLDIATNISTDESSKEVLSKITQLRILLMEDGNPVTKKELNKLKKGIKKDDFEELMQIRDGGSHVDFYIREEDDQITNVLMLVNDNDEFVLLSLEGLLKLEDLKNIKIDTDGAKHFEKIKQKEIPRA